MSRQTALITGASSGIGSELARELAGRGYDLVLSARRVERLDELASTLRQQSGINVTVVPANLAEPNGGRKLAADIAERGLTIDILVNSAGLGLGGNLAEADAATLDSMMLVNVVALTQLTRALLPGMMERGRGRVLNLASTAAFQPGPAMAVYYATKAYVLSLSEALAYELRGSGVSVTALCPGPTATEFQDRAAIARTRLFASGLMRVSTAAAVARHGVEGMLAGRRVVIPGLLNKLVARSAAFTPRAILLPIVSYLQH